LSAALALSAALTSACALAPAPASAIASRPSDGALSPRLAELAKPSVRSAPPAKQAEELSLAAEGPGSLLRDGNRVVVDARFDQGAAAAVDDLRDAGAEVFDVDSRYQTVAIGVRPSELRRLSAVPRLAHAMPVLTPITSASLCPSGVVVSEGEQQLHAGEEPGEARDPSGFAVDGSGVTVGILSDSFDQATEAADGSGPVATKESQDVGQGDLPGVGNTCPGQTAPVKVLDDSETEGADEGRAMAQIVHDLAPGANLAFATAFTPDMFGFADNIRRLAEPILSGGAAADVIADDVFFFEEPFFQEGPVSTAVRDVTEEGVSYFSAAGNDNLFDSSGNEIASWEAQEFRESGSCPPAIEELPNAHGTHCLDFNPGAQVDKTFGIKVAPGEVLSVDLQWAEPWFGVGTDLDAFLLNSTGGLIAASGEDNIADSEIPFEFVQWENESSSTRTVQLVVNRYAGSLPRLKFALLENGFGVTGTEYPRSTGNDVVGPTVFGHSGSADAISVGAVRFDNSSAPEKYSSRGPVTNYFEPVEGTEPAEELPSPETLSKPDIAATDCGATTFFAFLEETAWRFCGTSAAAPHAAAVAALMLQEEPAATPQQIRLALQESASPVGGFGPCAIGSGLVDAVGAIAALLTPGSDSLPACAPPESGPVEEPEPPINEAEEKIEAANPPAEVPPPVVKPRPRTFFLLHPARVIRTSHLKAKAVFRFGASESGATFVCRVDGEPFRECRRRFVGRFAVGPHAMRVIARDAAGNSDRTPAVYRFRVKRVG
jgi:subtilisin family serine protease